MVIGYSKGSVSSLDLVPGYTNYSDPEVSGNWYYHTQLDPFYLRPLRHDVTSYHALQYASFLEASKLTEEDVAKCAAKNKVHGLDNPNAPFAEKVTSQDILDSEYIVSPIRSKELPPRTDGVTAMIVTTEDWAKSNKKEGVYVTGFGMSAESYYPGYRDFAGARSARLAAERAKKMAGVQDVQAAELYDLFPYQELILYKEIFGWDDQTIKDHLSSGYTTKKGGLPVNVSGGTICAHPILAAGLSRIKFATKHLTDNNKNVVLSHSQSGLGMQNNIVYILES